MLIAGVRRKGPLGPESASSMSPRALPVIIRSYVASDKLRLDKLLRFYSERPTIDEAIRTAAMGLDEQQKRHPHQRRLKRAALLASQAALLAAASSLESVKSFDSLFEWVESATASIRGLGDLYTYDIALRIGARLKLEPNAVYLHAGAREGAMRLGVHTRERKLPSASFPSELARLSPRDIENLLCIYKDELPLAP